MVFRDLDLVRVVGKNEPVSMGADIGNGKESEV